MTVPPGTGDQGDQADLPTPLRFASVARLASRWPVATLCQRMGVSRSGYYAWSDRLRRLADANPRRVASDALCVAIQDCHARSRGTYGSPRIHADLIAHGIRCSRRRVARLMAGLRLRGCRRNGRRARPGARGMGAPARALPAPDLVRRAFAVSGISRTNHIWVADTTAIRTGEGWLHLAVVIDLRSRRVVGWGASAVLDATLTGNAVRMALHRRRPARGQELVHHSDRGSTYTAWAFQALLRQAGITCSMGRPGTCLDNAVAETFFATLKVELIHRNPWPTRADVVQAIFDYVETWYNPHRRHGSLGYLSPVAFEASQPSAPSAPKPMPVR